MNLKEIQTNIKKSWNWVWHSDSIYSWIVALIIIFIFIKFIFFPVLSLLTGSSLPLAGVESSSMEHQIISDERSKLNLCGKTFTKSQDNYINFDEYWEICGNWYENNQLTKEQFQKFPLKNGFSKGDILITWGYFTPKVGDIIIFKPNKESLAPRPIVHRIVKIENNIIQTKGDHNQDQLTINNNNLKTDETTITEEQIIGKAIIKIPYLGWFKIWITDLFNKIFS